MVAVTKWRAGKSGDFDTKAKWSAGVPTAKTDALIGVDGKFTVTVADHEATRNLMLAAPDATLWLRPTGMLAGNQLALRAGTLLASGGFDFSKVVLAGGVFKWHGPSAAHDDFDPAHFVFSGGEFLSTAKTALLDAPTVLSGSPTFAAATGTKLTIAPKSLTGHAIDTLTFGDGVDDGLIGWVGGGVGVARMEFNNVRFFANDAHLDAEDLRLAASVLNMAKPNTTVTAGHLSGTGTISGVGPTASSAGSKIEIGGGSFSGRFAGKMTPEVTGKFNFTGDASHFAGGFIVDGGTLIAHGTVTNGSATSSLQILNHSGFVAGGDADLVAATLSMSGSVRFDAFGNDLHVAPGFLLINPGTHLSVGGTKPESTIDIETGHFAGQDFSLAATGGTVTVGVTELVDRATSVRVAAPATLDLTSLDSATFNNLTGGGVVEDSAGTMLEIHRATFSGHLTGGMAVDVTGSATLTGANGFTGGLTVDQGAHLSAGDGALGQGGGIAINGGTLTLIKSTIKSTIIANDLSLSGNVAIDPGNNTADLTGGLTAATGTELELGGAGVAGRVIFDGFTFHGDGTAISILGGTVTCGPGANDLGFHDLFDTAASCDIAAGATLDLNGTGAMGANHFTGGGTVEDTGGGDGTMLFCTDGFDDFQGTIGGGISIKLEGDAALSDATLAIDGSHALSFGDGEQSIDMSGAHFDTRATFDMSSGGTSTLVFDQNMNGDVVGFGAGDAFVFKSVAVFPTKSVEWHPDSDNKGGVLEFVAEDDNHKEAVVGQIHLEGTYTQQNFGIDSSDPAGFRVFFNFTDHAALAPFAAVQHPPEMLL